MYTEDQIECELEILVDDFARGDYTIPEACHEMKFLGFDKKEAEAYLQMECPERFEDDNGDLSPRDQAKLDNYNFVHNTTL